MKKRAANLSKRLHFRLQDQVIFLFSLFSFLFSLFSFLFSLFFLYLTPSPLKFTTPFISDDQSNQEEVLSAIFTDLPKGKRGRERRGGGISYLSLFLSLLFSFIFSGRI